MEPINLSNHIKHGATFYTPFTNPKGFGAKLSLSSWSTNWLPEYLWIGIIIQSQGRQQALNNLYHIIKDLKVHDIAIPQMSLIGKLDKEKQLLFWKTVTKHVDKATLLPLTVIITPDINPVFYSIFFDFSIDIDISIEMLLSIIKRCLSFHDELSTDICYIVDWFYVCNNKLYILENSDLFPEALTEYYKHEHSESKMRCYRPAIRSAFQVLCQIHSDKSFSSTIWKLLGEISPCELFITKCDRNDNMDFYNTVIKTMEYFDATNESKKMEVKYMVIMGLICYICKLYKEIVEQNLQNAASGRIIFRSIVDTYINLKYLLIKENEYPDIYDKFKAYGYGKYKLVMSKLREKKYSLSDEAMLNQHYMEMIVNEDMNEAFVNIDVGFFDRINIRDKYKECNENELYEILYEYTTNFSHGFWGAIRESALLICANPAHTNHLVPDYYSEQESRSVLHDCEMIIRKAFNCITPYILLPDFYIANSTNNEEEST